ncbi:alpha-D-ribose 1-methylphosphonate 5-phosphate C-P lyase [Saccharopolyspora kobensis]|uniref:Alpha-D-ribose 1-methylphosphonate 5-phosphate C-P lyase n=2 Tax=Saccharopolyspora kobensis TaxID=146035 RepID=A0A1H6CU03_9PSEU|nr:alpha-D-ribose 1-methylphosphonate 5-phosphate C-P-lyase PhnJ [Saccharopolyspora kobensis]SEG76559.1 alpha-D-ribose 1-methylphosphonate 5-phosphate C-P lyase [Saccharopolyspora kobensis]SFC99662.1 alpha-D-ribose 1-methylphosphonate 5-phosphate C-P lyase [Saccharopolyspora kobensis]
MSTAVRDLLVDDDNAAGILDEGAKREIRRAALVAVCVPGYQVPFGSREMPVARGWGSGGLQVTLAVIGEPDVVKVIDQGDDGGVNAVNLRRMISATTGCAASTDTREATVIQTRHRIPEEKLTRRHVLVYQVPVPEPLRGVQKSVVECARMHAENDYSAMWVSLYEDMVRNGVITKSTGYPVLVDGRYVLATSPVPRWDVPKLHQCEHLNLYGAGREKRIYAIPPHTDVVPLTFDDIPFEVEQVPGASCKYCGSTTSFLVEGGAGEYVCSDSDWCSRVEAGDADVAGHRLPAELLPAVDRRPVEVVEAPRPVDGPEWTLRVEGIGRVYGPGGADAVPGTGPEHGTATSPSTGAVVAAWDVSFDVAPGEALGIIGESGSGKSTALRCVIGDEPATSGSVYLAGVDGGGTDLLGLDSAQRRKLRVDTMAVVYQDPAAGLDLRVTAGGNVAERLTAAGWRGYRAIRKRAAELLDRVEVPLSRMDDPVVTFSGGMRQRVQIAKALATEPPVLLLDEPTTGLDASVAAGVLDLLRGLLSERDIAAVVVSHDFAVIEALTDRSLVMQLGRVVERGLTDQLFADPHHPYTQRLVAAARR